MATTTNFGWETPDDTDLVKDGAAAIRTLGSAIDTSLVDLKGGTTGQVLSKTSNSDMDFTWVAQDDSNAIQNAIIDAKGDLISATAADTPARLASSGVNGDVLQVDTTTATGLKWGSVSASGMTLISTVTASNQATVDFTSISGTYKDLRINIRGLKPATDSSTFYLRYNSDSNTRYNFYGLSGSNASTRDFNTTQLTVADQVDNGTSTGFICITFFDYANTTTWKNALSFSMMPDTTTNTSYYPYRSTLMYNQTSAITSMSFFMSAGNITSGVFELYGVK